jgi:hypothetical protein
MRAALNGNASLVRMLLSRGAKHLLTDEVPLKTQTDVSLR